MDTRRHRRLISLVAGIAAACLIAVLVHWWRVGAQQWVGVRGRDALYPLPLRVSATAGWMWEQISKLLHPTTLVVVIATLIVIDMWRVTVKIDPFDMPKNLQDAGFTPRVMGNRMGAALMELQERTQSVAMKQMALNYSSTEIDYDLEIPATKMGLRTVIEVVREAFGHRALRFSGNVVASSDASSSKIVMTIYASWGRKQIKIGQLEGRREYVDALVSRAAEVLLEHANPYLFGVLLLVRKEPSRAMKVGQRMISEESRFSVLAGRKAARKRRVSGNLLTGIALSDMDNFDGAIEQFQLVLAAEPRSVQAYNCWGVAFYRRKQYAEAVTMFQKTIKLDPRYAAAYTNWGIVLNDQKHHEEAVAKHRKAIDLDPEFAKAYGNCGLALTEQGLYDEAIRKYEQALELDSNFALAYVNWGVLLAKQKRFVEAMEKFAKAIEISPKERDAYFVWGTSLCSLERYAEAIRKFAKTVEIDAKYARGYCYWGLALVGLGLHSEAAEKYGRAVELKEDYPDAYANWGACLAEQGSYAEGIAKYKRAIEILPDHVLSYRLWGLTLNEEANGATSEDEARAMRAQATEKLAKADELEQSASRR